jgi:hypothetical protein
VRAPSELGERGLDLGARAIAGGGDLAQRRAVGIGAAARRVHGGGAHQHDHGVEPEGLAAGGGLLQEIALAGGHDLQARADDAAEIVGQRGALKLGGVERPALVVVATNDGAELEEVARELGERARHAAHAIARVPRQRLGRRARRTAQLGEQLRRLGLVERAELEAHEIDVALAERGMRVEQRRARDAQDRDRRRAEPGGEIMNQVHRLRRGALDVVDGDAQGRARRVGGEEALERDEGARLELRRRLGQRLDDGRVGVGHAEELRQKMRDLHGARRRHQLGDGRSDASAPDLRRHRRRQVEAPAQQALPGGERRRARPARGREQKARARAGERAPELLDEARLADAGRPGERDEGDLAARGIFDDRAQPLELRAASDEAGRLRIARRLLDEIVIVEQFLVGIGEIGAERRRHALGAAALAQLDVARDRRPAGDARRRQRRRAALALLRASPIAISAGGAIHGGGP